MKEKSLILIWVWIWVLAWGLCSSVFKSAFMDYINTNNLSQNGKSFIQRIYNPISGFYEQRSEENIKVTDFYSDDSFQRFLDDNHPLSVWYEAPDIVKINSDFITNWSSTFYLREEAAIQFADMARAFSNAFGFKSHLTINSAWRSQAFQRKLANNCSAWRCANPWTSEHEVWLALDLGVNWWNIKWWDWKYYQRLIDNAHLRWFHNSYQRWIEVDGKIVEPRHRRYVWVELATILHDNQQTFSEYFYSEVENNNSDFN